jgi:hypothetical protein
MKTAKSLGLTFPLNVLALEEEVKLARMRRVS